MSREQYEAIFAWFRARPKAKAILKAADAVAVAAVYAVYLGLLGLLAWQRSVLFWGVLLVPAFAFLTGTALRAALNRPRPYETLGFTPLFAKATHGKSMPSRHSFCAAAIAVAAAAVNGPLGMMLLILALFIATTRVLIGVHWPGDVIVGLAFGFAVGIVGFALFFRLVG